MKYLLFSIFLSCSLIVYAQLPVSLELHNRLQEVDDDERVPVIIQGNKQEINAFLSELNKKPIFRTSNFTRSNLSKKEIEKAIGKKLRISGGIQGQILNDSVRVQTGANLVHQGLGGLIASYQGEGVVVGILDSGIDYRHPDFNDENGNSRIYSIWDQTKTGPTPSGFNYGYLCDSTSIADGTCPSMDERWNAYHSHGTHVAGTAAANDQLNNNLFTGMAPKATIIGVALDFNNFSTSVIDGTKYIYDTAQALGMPAVINLSAGSYSGPHDGKNLITYALEDLVTDGPGRSFVAAAGNAGDRYLHLRHSITSQPQFTYFKHRGSGSNLRFDWTLYADSINFRDVNFQLQVDNKSTFAKLGESAVYNILADFPDPGNGVIQQQEQILSSGGQVLGDITFSVEKFEGRYGVRILINNTSGSYWWRFTTWGNGLLDVYSNGSLTGTSNMVRESELPSDFPELSQYTSPDLTQNTVGYFSASPKTISVGYQVSKNEFLDYDGNLKTYPEMIMHDIMYTSSIGPNRDGALKPDVVSSGAWVASAGNEDYLQHRLNTNAFLFGVTTDNMHFRNRGSSMSSPAVAGGVALLFESNPSLSSEEVKQLVLNNAVKDSFTGPTENTTWGHGKFNIHNILSTTGGVLPVKWESFVVQKGETNYADILWSTSSEYEVSHFNVKRSFDSMSWETVHQISAENQPNGSSYQFLDENLPINQTIYYQIESVDLDGSKDYTSIQSIYFEGYSDWEIAENPVKTQVNLLVPRFHLGDNLQVEVFDVKGYLVSAIEIDQTVSQIPISVSGISNGLYIIMVKKDNQIIHQDKFIVHR